MSKQSEAKAAQGYVEKPVPRTCTNCANLRFDMQLPAWMQKDPGVWGDQYKHEANHRCGIGGFKVKKTATCSRWEERKQTSEV